MSPDRYRINESKIDKLIKSLSIFCPSLRAGGAGVLKDEHPSKAQISPSNAVSISSSGILSMLNGFLLALMMRVK